MNTVILPLENFDHNKEASIKISTIDAGKSGQLNDMVFIFPSPGGITHTAEGSYAEFESGSLSTISDDTASEVGLNNIFSSVLKGASLAGGDAIKGIADGSKTAKLAMITQKVILNENKIAKFEGNAFRSFSFSFKFISRSSAESNAIKQITDYCNKAVYAFKRGEGVFLGYPPLWKIKFMIKGQENSYIPGIYECFMTSFSASSNSEGNVYYESGAPFSVEIKMDFKESKILTREDIVNLQTGKISSNAIDVSSLTGSSGVPSFLKKTPTFDISKTFLGTNFPPIFK
jgi:hypothetical protein